MLRIKGKCNLNSHFACPEKITSCNKTRYTGTLKPVLKLV